MILYPAIDLKAGKCVRLVKGIPSEATIYNDSPAAQAKEFAKCHCSWIHVVDLDGAIDGNIHNKKSIEEILAEISVPVQLGGGIRDINTIEQWLRKGISRIVLGTVAVERPELVKLAAQEFPNRIAVGIDARNGFAATHGWVEDSNILMIDLALRFEDCGVSAIIYTDIERDGVKTGPNIAATHSLAQKISIPVIASGGVSSLADLIQLRETCGILNGVIVGRALYDGSVSVKDALTALNGNNEI